MCVAFIAILLAFAWRLQRTYRQRGLSEGKASGRRNLAEQLIEAQKLAKCGSWELTLAPYKFVASQGYLDIYQMSEESCPRSSKEWIERFVRDPAGIAHAQADEALAEAGIESAGVRQVTLDDGTKKWIEYRKIPRKDVSGKVIGFRGIARDITAEHEAIEGLIERTGELERARKLAGFGTWRWDIATDRLISSDRMREIYRTTEANHPATFREWSERFIHPDDLAAYWPMYDARFDGKPFDRERRIVDATGVEVWIRTIAEPEFDAAGNLLAYDGVTMDITAQKHTMLQLARQTALLVEAQQVARMGSWYWDLGSDVLDISAEYRQFYGLSGDDPVPVTMNEWIETYCHPDEKAAAYENGQRIRGGERLDLHRRVALPGGEVRWIHVIAHPVKDARGVVVGCTGVTRDVTIEKEHELALIERTRQLSEAHRIAQMGHFYWDLATDEVKILNDDGQVFGDGGSAPFRTMREWEAKFCHPEDRPKSIETHITHVERGLPYVVQRRTVTLQGDVTWIETRAEPIRDSAGHVYAYRGAFRNITAQKEVELSLKESEEKYRFISENMHDVVALYAADGTILYCSPSTLGLLGFPAQGAIGKSPFHGVHPDDIEWVRGVVADLFDDTAKTSATLEYRFQHADGRYLWLETVVVPVRNADGSLKHYQAATRDVTERRNATDRVRRSEERFRALTEISADWYWETDAQHRLSFLSMDRTVHSHKERKDILGRTRWDIFPNALSSAEWDAHRRTLAAREPFQGLVTRVFDQSGTRPIGYSSISGRPFFDASGTFMGYRGVGRDITRIKLAERQLAESEERYRLMTQNMRDLISLHALDGRLTFVSPSFTTISGHVIERVLGRSPLRLLHREDLRRTKQRFAAIVEGDATPATITYRLRHRDGHYLWLESQVALVRAQDGTLSHVQVASRDVTARREAELAVARKTEELGHANRQLEVEVRRRQELERNILMTIEMELAQVGLELHDELGQDLTGIALLTKSLERRLAEKGMEGAADAARISDLVNRTIRHTRMISHGLSPYIWGMDGLVSALRQLASDINSLGVVVCETHLDQNIEIYDDLVARSLYRIAQESINNALKHSHAQRITLSLSHLKNGVELTISDNGHSGASATSNAVSDDPLEAGSRFHSIRHRCSAIDAALSIKRGKHGGATVRVTWRRSPALRPARLPAAVSGQEAV
ncbi:MAG: PAS domain S-box protein [Betaproteobacteria bacterium]|nr:PAS domain S-box protein [Betaproteobacteria bacterium]